MKLKKLAVWAVVAFAAFAVFTNPRGSSDGVNTVVDSLRGTAESLITFLGALF